MSSGGQPGDPAAASVCPELDVGGHILQGMAGPRAEGLTVKPVEGRTRAVTTPAPAGTIPMVSRHGHEQAPAAGT